MKLLQSIYLLLHGWRPVKTDWGWRWYQRQGNTELRLLRHRALRMEKDHAKTV